MNEHADRDHTEPPREAGHDHEQPVKQLEDVSSPRVVAPAGLPLHEPTDRDADNVPSDRVPTWCTECLEGDHAACPSNSCGCAVRDHASSRTYKTGEAYNAPSDRVRAYREAIEDATQTSIGTRLLTVGRYDDAARAAMAVADREQAPLRALIQQMRETWLCQKDADELRAEAKRVQRIEDGWRRTNAECIAALNRAEKAEATTARVEALAEEWSTYGEGSAIENVMGRQSVTIDTAVRLIRAALRGPEPTEDGA